MVSQRRRLLQACRHRAANINLRQYVRQIERTLERAGARRPRHPR